MAPIANPEYDLVVRGGTSWTEAVCRRFVPTSPSRAARSPRSPDGSPAGAAEELDASGCIVAPGAVDLHCHYDAQVNWDPYCTLSGWHGITSLTIGQCGFGFRPDSP